MPCTTPSEPHPKGRTVLKMPTVYVKADYLHRTRFHRDPGCRDLRKASARGGAGNPLIAVDLEDVQARPCLRCYPDAPHVSIVKAYCVVCDSKHACEHNGGVQIIDRGGRKYWMWPDNNSFRHLSSAQ